MLLETMVQAFAQQCLRKFVLMEGENAMQHNATHRLNQLIYMEKCY